MAKCSSHSASTSLLSLPTSSNHLKRTSSSFMHFPQNMGALTLSTRLTDCIGSLIRNISVYTNASPPTDRRSSNLYRQAI
nr:unnamed protein product [Callosobruchus chinensis]